MITTTIFAKARRTHEGKAFTSYCTQLTRKDGSKQYADVRFRQSCGVPDEFPVNIDIAEGNVSKRHVTDPVDESEKTYYTLWVKAWKKSATEFKDDSLDEFM